MGTVSRNTAILFFTRSAEAEVHHKKFTADTSIKTDIQIAEHLISHTYRQITATGLPFFIFDEQHQVGNSFGKRFANAFSKVFEQGYNYVIAVGNDIPRLTAKHITNTAQKLKEGAADIVLGPDIDGGTWLMGYRREAFSTEEFQSLPWQTQHLLDTILTQHSSDFEIALLEKLRDIDDHRSLQAFANSRLFDRTLLKLIKRLHTLLSSTTSYLPRIVTARPKQTVYRNNLLRAPPTC